MTGQILFALIYNLAIYIAAVAVLAVIAHRARNDAGVAPCDTQGLVAYIPTFLRERAVRIVIGGVIAVMWGGVGGAVLLLAWSFFSGRRAKAPKFFSEKEMRQRAAAANTAWLASLGATHAQRAGAIENLFAERNHSISACYFAHWQQHSSNEGTATSYVFFTVTRNLATMDNREREYLRIAELLNSAADGKNDDYLAWRAALLWGDGKGVIEPRGWQALLAGKKIENAAASVADAIKAKNLSLDQTVTSITHHLAELRGRPALAPELRALAEETGERLTQGSNAWLKPAQIGKTLFAPQGAYALHIGSFPDGTPLTYSGEGSMVTIAPPGSGKTQCNVFPNLLAWPGPAVVLDISGDIFEHTSKWRAENVGPVFKFSPLEPANSHRYNPLTFVRNEPDYIWEDARLLAELMIVPSGGADPFWENEARTVLTAAIAYVCHGNPPEQRPMHAVLDIMFGGKAWEEMITGLRMALDVRVMMQHANSLASMNEKTLGSVLQTARSSLNAWTGERIARVTVQSDWSPLDLRGGRNPTIYIHMRPNEVDAYLSLLRVFIGQHIRMLTGGPVPPRGSAPILFMLDELPRLRYMPPVDEALNIGRKYGLRLWLFAQSLGQLQNAYENADGMLGSCAVRIFMNPSGADGLAERLSEELGYVDSVNDAARKRLVEATELAGPAFRDQQIVLGLGAPPARVKKDFAWQNPVLQPRMGSHEPAAVLQGA